MDGGKRGIAATFGEEGAEEISFPEQIWLVAFGVRRLVKHLDWVSVQVREGDHGHASVDETEGEEGAKGIGLMVVFVIIAMEGKNNVEDQLETFYW